MSVSRVIPLLLFLHLFCRGQERPADSHGIERTPANAWRSEALRPKTIPSTESERRIRTARDAYEDKAYGAGMAVEDMQQLHYGFNMSDTRELPTGTKGIPAPFPGETVLVGTFDSFDQVLTQSHKAIYSEIHVGVDRVLFPLTSTATGTTIDILEAGGSVILDNGKTYSYNVYPRMYGIKPYHRYALFLRHIQPGDFYLLATSIEVDNGIARANTPDDAEAAKAGNWPFLSMREVDLVDRLSTLLKLQHQ